MKRALALFLSITMMLSVSSMSFAADPAQTWGITEGEGSGGVMDPIISYQVPTILNFSLDAFSMGDATGSQIFSPSFSVINKSQVAIKVDVKADLTLATGVTAMASVADVTVDDTAVDTKELYMEMVAQEITGSTLIDSGILATAIVYDPAGTTPGAQTPAKAVLAVKGTATGYVKPTLMTLALEKATYTTAAPPVLSELANKTGAAKFRFAGTINPNAKWVGTEDAEDIKVSAVFDVRGLTGPNYTALMPDDLVEGLKKANVASVGAGGGGGSSESSVTIASFTQGSALTFAVNVGSGANALTSLRSATLSGSNCMTNLTFNATAGTLVANAGLISFAKTNNPIVLTFNTVGDGTPGTKIFTLTCVAP